jgi:hypothetical protein
MRKKWGRIVERLELVRFVLNSPRRYRHNERQASALAVRSGRGFYFT